MICRMIKTSTDSVLSCMCMRLATVTISLSRAFVPCSILPTCGVPTEMAASRDSRWPTCIDGKVLLLKLPRSCSASWMFVNVGVPTCFAIIWNRMYRFMWRLSGWKISLFWSSQRVELSQVFMQTVDPLAHHVCGRSSMTYSHTHSLYFVVRYLVRSDTVFFTCMLFK